MFAVVRTKLLLAILLMGVIVSMGAMFGCSQNQNESRAMEIANQRIGANLSGYGAVVRSDCSDESGESFAEIELRFDDENARNELERIVSAEFGVRDLQYQPLPPMSGKAIAKNMNEMQIERAYWGSIEGNRAKSIDIYIAFATSGDDQYMFYIG